MNPNQLNTIRYTIRPHDNLWLLAHEYGTTVNEILNSNPGMDLNMLHAGQTISIPSRRSNSPTDSASRISCISKSAMDLKEHLRLLWEQHIVWTRLTILSIVFGLPDENLVTNRLLRNPKDFTEALKPFYGDRTASRFADLLTNHLAIAAQLVKAAKAGDTNAAADAEKRWYANADELAAFLGSINPYWSQSEWKNLLRDHLAMTKSEAVNMLNQNYAAGIDDFDRIEKEALQMADVMARGIISQFPERFAR